MGQLFRTSIGILIALFFLSCHKEFSLESVNSGIGLPNRPDTVKSSINGHVVDENNIPKQGVTVRAGTLSTITDIRGYFIIKDCNLDKYASVVTAECPGYFKSFRNFSAQAGNIEFVKIKLLPKTQAGTLNTITGGSVTVTGNGTISFPPSAFILKSNGSAYNGTVKVFAGLIDPSSHDIAQTIPGSLLGIDSNNVRVKLESFGMMAVEIEGTAGEKLQLAPGKKAALKIPIPASLIGSSPVSLPMWYLDENSGIWKQEGRGTKNGNNYTGDVSHFTFWNYDLSTPGVFLEMKIIDSLNKPVPNTLIKLVSPTGRFNYGYTDSRGYIGLIFGKDVHADLQVIDDFCDQTIYTKPLDAYSQNTNLGNINITMGNNGLYVSGIVKDCNNNVIIQGNVILFFENKYYNTRIGTGGSFGISLPNCHSTTTVELYATDEQNNLQGVPQNFDIATGNVQALQLTACVQVSNASGTVFVGGKVQNYDAFYAIDAVTGTIKWTKMETTFIGSTPTLANGKLYYSSYGDLNTIDTITHQLVNVFSNYQSTSNPIPTYYNGAIYITDKYNTRAIDVNTGNIIFSNSVGQGTDGHSACTIYNGSVYNQDLVAINLSTLAVSYNDNNGIPLWNTWNSSDAISNGTVYVGGGNNHSKYLLAYDPNTLTIKWKYLVDTVSTINNTGFDWVSSSPTVANNIVYFTSRANSLYALNANTGALLWAKPGNSSSSAIVGANSVFVPGGVYGTFVAYDPMNGNVKWSTNIKVSDNSPVYANGVVYIVSLENSDRKLYSLNAYSGAINWSVSIGNISAVVDPIVVDKNGVVYHPSTSGEVN